MGLSTWGSKFGLVIAASAQRRGRAALGAPWVFAPDEDQLRAFLKAAAESNPGIGLLDTRTGRIYLRAASTLADGDHASLVEEVLGIADVDDATHLRGFVIGIDRKGWRVLNHSGLNPRGNRMEPELFEEVRRVLLKSLAIDL